MMPQASHSPRSHNRVGDEYSNVLLIKACLSKQDIFRGFSEGDFDVIIQTASRRLLRKKDYLYREGDLGESMYVLLQGRTRSFTSDDQGKEFVLESNHAGDVFGQLSLLDGEPRSWSVQAEEDSEILVFSKADFHHALKAYPDLKDKLIENLVRVIRQHSKTIKHLALLDVYGRMRILFDQLSSGAGKVKGQNERDPYPLNEPLTQQAIADRVGSSREMIARILKELANGGYIRVKRKTIFLLRELPEHF